MPHRTTYVALVAALRAEFTPLNLESLDIQLREHRNNPTSLGTLAQAVHDAHDINYVIDVPNPAPVREGGCGFPSRTGGMTCGLPAGHHDPDRDNDYFRHHAGRAADGSLRAWWEYLR